MKLGRPPTPVANPFWVKVNKDKREGCVHCIPDYVPPQNTEDDWCYCDCHVMEQDFPLDEAIGRARRAGTTPEEVARDIVMAAKGLKFVGSLNYQDKDLIDRIASALKKRDEQVWDAAIRVTEDQAVAAVPSHLEEVSYKAGFWGGKKKILAALRAGAKAAALRKDKNETETM